MAKALFTKLWTTSEDYEQVLERIPENQISPRRKSRTAQSCLSDSLRGKMIIEASRPERSNGHATNAGVSAKCRGL